MGELQEYQDVLRQIKADASSAKDRLPVRDTGLTKTGEQEYQDVLQQIEADASSSKDRLPVSDTGLIKTVEKEHRNQDPEYVRRNQLYTELLAQYISEYRSKDAWKKGYKAVFFTVIMLSFAGIITVSIIALSLVAHKEEPTVTDLGTILGSVAGILSSILVLPRIIAEHLFPKDEDSNMISMVKNMQLNDSEIRRDRTQPSAAEEEGLAGCGRDRQA